MSDSKKYYYLKLKDDFFDNENMKILESMENGYIYSNIIMKMYLRSLKDNGRLMLNERIPYNPKMIAAITGHNVDHVEKAISVFLKLSLIEILDNGAIYLLDIQNYIGQSSTEADRKRMQRSRIDNEKKLLDKGQCPTINGQMSGQMSDNPPPELELELELEQELELDIKKASSLTNTREASQCANNVYECDKKSEVKKPIVNNGNSEEEDSASLSCDRFVKAFNNKFVYQGFRQENIVSLKSHVAKNLSWIENEYITVGIFLRVVLKRIIDLDKENTLKNPVSYFFSGTFVGQDKFLLRQTKREENVGGYDKPLKEEYYRKNSKDITGLVNLKGE